MNQHGRPQEMELHTLDAYNGHDERRFRFSDSEKTIITPTSRYLPEDSRFSDSAPHNDQITGLEEKEDEVVYPGPIKLAFITLALCLAVFLVALDQTIIATAVPKITDQFHTMNDIGWYGSAYMFTVCSFQLLYGKLYTFYSLKYTFLTALGIFEIGSFVCGIAPSSAILIVGRAIAGIGCSGIFSGGLIILAHSVPLHKRPIFTGIVVAMYGVASVIGPILGGWLTDSKLTWRWCFYINLPAGVVTVLIIMILFTPPQRKRLEELSFKQKLTKFDIPGTLCLIPAVVTLLLALQWAGAKYPWSHGVIIGLLTLASAFVILFIIIQAVRKDNGTLPPRIICQRSVACGALFSFCMGASFFMLVYYLPLWFQAIQGQTPVQSGIKTLPLILGVIVFCGVSGVIVITTGYYTPMMIIATICTAVGAGLLTTWTKDSNTDKTLGYQLIVGIGLGFGIIQPLIAAQTVLDLDDVPTGTTAMIFFQTLGAAIFISVGQTVFNNKFFTGIQAIFPGASPEQFISIGATNLKKMVPPFLLNRVLDLYNDALARLFYIPLILACLSAIASLFMEWRSVKGIKLEVTAL